MKNFENLIFDPQWKSLLKAEFSKDYMKNLDSFLEKEGQEKKVIYPAYEQIFSALNLTPFSKVKVVIIGQDPYHGANQAHGLCFSVQKEIKIPPSLVNIFKELHTDLNITPSIHGDLSSWAHAGVLLLNSTLTVEKCLAGSHQKKGWEIFTDKIIEVLNEKKENLVFLLWGLPAQKKAHKVDQQKHLILKSPHPSPLSSYRGFFGQKHFSKTNTYLKNHHISEINWALD